MISASEFRNSIGSADQPFVLLVKQVLADLIQQDVHESTIAQENSAHSGNTTNRENGDSTFVIS